MGWPRDRKDYGGHLLLAGMIYLTYNDAVNGIFSGQVTDQCTCLRESHQLPVQLISYFPRKLYKAQRSLLLKEDRSALALNAFFPLRLFKWNVGKLRKIVLQQKQDTVIARGIFACTIALKLKKAGQLNKVIYDGRGAVMEEFKEYIDLRMAGFAGELERKAVLESDFRIAVSEKLTEYWKDTYGYSGSRQVIIPTTLNSRYSQKLLTQEEKDAVRARLGFSNKDVLIVYSGGGADWQSFSMLEKWVELNFLRNSTYRLLVLSASGKTLLNLSPNIQNRVVQTSVHHDKVAEVLSACDHGLLLRENSITNKVSAPTKFAEYLAAGLSLIISPGIGDYSNLVTSHALGVLAGKDAEIVLTQLAPERRKQLRQFALDHFSKQSSEISSKYVELLNAIK